MFNVDQYSFAFHKIESPIGQKRISSLTFGPCLKAAAPLESSTAWRGVLYAVLEDSFLAALLYNDGSAITCGPWDIDQSSKVLYLHCVGEVKLRLSLQLLDFYYLPSLEIETHCYQVAGTL